MPCFYRGQRPIITEQYEFKEDPLYKEWNKKETRTSRGKETEVLG